MLPFEPIVSVWPVLLDHLSLRSSGTSHSPPFLPFFKKTFSYYVYSVLPEHIPAHQKSVQVFFFSL